MFKKICTIIVYMFSDWMRTHQVPLVKTKDLPGMYKIQSHVIGPRPSNCRKYLTSQRSGSGIMTGPIGNSVGLGGKKSVFSASQ